MNIEELEAYFASAELPVAIDSHPAVDIPKFVNDELYLVRFEETRTPAYQKLIELKNALDERVN